MRKVWLQLRPLQIPFGLKKQTAGGKKAMVIMPQVPYFLLDLHTPNQENV